MLRTFSTSGDRGEPRDDPVLVEPFWTDLCRRDPQEAEGSNACVVGLSVHLDEVFVKINGERHYLWRAVD